MSDARNRSRNFIEDIIEKDLKSNKWAGRVHTRFPPEPNGYLHIGHAKSICLNFGLAEKYGGKCNLRFDDTNPIKEEQEYVDSIQANIRWLGWDWQDRLYFASDYFDQMYAWAAELVKKGKAFVCDLTGEQVAQQRGTLKTPGRESPTRNRSVDENLDLFERMKNGEFPDGSRTLRAKIDMAHPNMNLRDPVMYRILHARHHRTGDKWCIYPMYDWAHGLEDSIENITHSICTLEFEDHRPLYDWFLHAINEGRGPGSEWGEKIPHPQQIEFARLELNYTVMSKRRLLELVKEKHVRGWDDPRMPTLSAMRRRGYPPEAIRDFCDRVGVAKFKSTIDIALLHHCIRDYLNKHAPRVMAVLRPLKVVIENYPEGESEELDAVNNPEDPAAGTRNVPFSRTLYIERDDFMEDPPKKFFRLAPDREVRLRYAYFITCKEVVKDDAGNVVELRCTYDPATRGGDAPDGRKVKATLHWVSAAHALPCEARLYEHLFTKEDPDDAEASRGLQPARTSDASAARTDTDAADPSSLRPSVPPSPPSWKSSFNPNSLEVISRACIEPSVKDAAPGTRYQFERLGYFCVDPDTTPDKLVFNRTVTLKDTWAKIAKKT